MMINEAPLSPITQARKHFKDLDFHSYMSKHIRSYLPDDNREIIVVCIGTDRCTGDALGPLTGTNLSKLNLRNLIVYGTIHTPVHAKNLEKTINKIYATYKNPFIIALDASLGKSTSVGSILAGRGSLQPGAALKKDLPKVGHVYIAGIVNVSGYMEFQILQNTRLSIVIDMATVITRLLHSIDRHLSANDEVTQLS